MREGNTEINTEDGSKRLAEMDIYAYYSLVLHLGKILTTGNVKIILTVDSDLDCLSHCCVTVGKLTSQFPHFPTQTSQVDSNSKVLSDRITETIERTRRITARSVNIQKITVDTEVCCISDVCKHDDIHGARFADTELQDNSGVSLHSEVRAVAELHTWNGTKGDT